LRFSDKITRQQKGKAERRKAHCPINIRVKRGCALLALRRARLSALTLAALATGSTRWLSSRTGFPAAVADGSFARFAQRKKCRG
jgi:hypothetical protein